MLLLTMLLWEPPYAPDGECRVELILIDAVADHDIFPISTSRMVLMMMMGCNIMHYWLASCWVEVIPTHLHSRHSAVSAPADNKSVNGRSRVSCCWDWHWHWRWHWCCVVLVPYRAVAVWAVHCQCTRMGTDRASARASRAHSSVGIPTLRYVSLSSSSSSSYSCCSCVES